MLASMKFSVMRTSGHPRGQLGAILALFRVVYAVPRPIGGYLRIVTAAAVIAGSLLWSLVTWTTDVTTTEQLLATRADGHQRGVLHSTALALIADFHTGPTRSRAIGLHQMGIYVGVIVGGFGGYAADHPNLGWRWAFDVCGLVGVLYAVPLFLLLRNRVRSADAPPVSRPSPGGALRELLGNGSFLLLVLYFTLPALAGWIVRDWMPAILKAEFGIGQGLAGVSATIYWQTAAIVGAVAGGWLADRWMRRSVRGRIFVSAIGMGLIVPAMFGVGYAPQSGQLSVAVGFLVLFGLVWGLFYSNNLLILC